MSAAHTTITPPTPTGGSTSREVAAPMPSRSHRALLAVMASLCLLGAVACGSASSGSAAGPAGSSVPRGAAATTVATDPLASLPTLDLQAVEHHAGAATTYGFDGPTSVPAGKVVIRLTNGGTEEHQAGVARLKPGVSADQVDAIVASGNPMPALALIDPLGGPAAVAPKGTGKGIVELKPGQYYLYCFVQDAAGIPHMAHGMVTKLEVTAPTPSTTPPAAASIPEAGTITMKDFGIVLSDGFGAKGWYRVTNTGAQNHEALVYRPAAGKSPRDLSDAMTAYTDALSGKGPMPTEPFPAEGVGGASAAAPGFDQWVWLELDPSNRYLFICGIPDAEKGMVPHFMEGMSTWWPATR